MFTQDTLANRAIIITGGGSGLGLAMAKRFAELGASIAICGRRQETLSQAEEELKALGAAVYAEAVDIREHDRVEQFVRKASEALGSLDGLVNNAAGNFYCASEDLTPGGFQTIVDIVLGGSFNCSHCFGKYLIAEKKGGAILNIVTTYTETGSAFVLPSACAKAGVYALTTTLAYEWAAYGIRVNAIAPGPIPTKGAWDRLMPDGSFEERYRELQPMGRFGTPLELANSAAFLMSDLSSYINGECLTVDGGERLRGGQFNFITSMMPRSKLKSLFKKVREASRK